MVVWRAPEARKTLMGGRGGRTNAEQAISLKLALGVACLKLDPEVRVSLQDFIQNGWVVWAERAKIPLLFRVV